MNRDQQTATRWIGGELLMLSRFAIVGVAATSIHIGAVWILIRQFHVPPLLANLLAFGGAFAVSFIGQYRWTFRSEQDWSSVLRRFLAVSACGFLLNNVVLFGLLKSHLVSSDLSAALSACVVPLVTYMLNRVWVFK